MDKNRKIMLAALLAGLLVLFFMSCGDDNVTNAPCTNCDFWSRAFGGAGRFPSASPVDPQLVAFSSLRDTSGTSSKYHVWVVKRAAAGDTTRSYQITFDAYHDYNPAWSPDGQRIAFERNIGAGDEWQIFVVDVSDLNSPGLPQAITETDSSYIAYSNRSPSWVTLGVETWISFCNVPEGSGDSDIMLIGYPDLGDPVRVSIDPKDFADSTYPGDTNEGGVMSATLDDELASSNGTNRIVFSSPNRQEVVDIRVIATSEEQPDSAVVAEIVVNDKPSNQVTPYTFRYRPVLRDVDIEGQLKETYCVSHSGSLIVATDTLYTYLIDFVHTHGTIGVRSNPGNRWIYFGDNTQPEPEPTHDDGLRYRFFTCLLPDTNGYSIWTQEYYRRDSCYLDSPVYVVPGETTFVSFECETGTACQSMSYPGAARRSPSATVVAAPRPLQENARSLWLVDLGNEAATHDDETYLIDASDVGIFYPTLSPDGKYVAYVMGQDTSWDLIVRDVSDLEAGGPGRRIVIGLPGSSEDIECWRKLEKISWLPKEAGRQIAASISVCRGGHLYQYEIWIADLSRFLD